MIITTKYYNTIITIRMLKATTTTTKIKITEVFQIVTLAMAMIIVTL
jgi:hypothetical protein